MVPPVEVPDCTSCRTGPHVGRRAAHGWAECAAVADCAGLSQAGLAERIGVDRAYISGLELGQRNPTIVTLWHMTKALGVTLKPFFDEEKPRRRVSREKN